MSDSMYHGDSIVSQYSIDRAAAERIKESSQHHQEHAHQPVIDFEKEELRERIAALEEKLATRDLDLAKSNKLIKGLHKLIPKDAAQTGTASGGSTSESPSIMDERLARDRVKLISELNSPSSSVTDAANTTVGIDMVMNGTIAPEDLQTMKYEFVRFRDLCSKMFQQLQGTASFLEKLIRHLESSDDEAAKKLLAKIKGIHLDLNVSMNDASVMIESAQNAEMSLHTALEKSIRISMAPNSEIIALNDKIIETEKKYTELKKKYTRITQTLTFTTKQNEKLQQELVNAQEKVETIQNALTEKETQLNAILEEKKLAAAKAQNLVPEILQEMTNIKTTLEDVSKATKNLPRSTRRR